jgi:hypothetical protein
MRMSTAQRAPGISQALICSPFADPIDCQRLSFFPEVPEHEAALK